MTSPPVIETMTNRERRFYALVGPYLSRREIVSELGFPVWDEDTKTWYVALRNEDVCGFAAMKPDAYGGTVLCSAYVLPEHRGEGIYEALLRARIADAPTGRIHAVATESSVKALRRAGLKPVRNKGKYTVMEMQKS